MREPEGRINPPEPEPVGHCDHCKAELFDGDSIYTTDEGAQCCGVDCLLQQLLKDGNIQASVARKYGRL